MSLKYIKIERVLNARIILVTDSHINFSTRLDKRRFAYYLACNNEASPQKIFEEAILKDIPVNMLIIREQKGKQYDYIKSVELIE